MPRVPRALKPGPRRPSQAVRGAVVALVAWFTATPAAGEPPSARQDALLDLLRHDCGSCHGLHLRGGLGPALTASALDEKTPQVLETVIAHGVPGTPMPPWKSLLTTDEIAWLVSAMKHGLAQLPTGGWPR